MRSLNAPLVLVLATAACPGDDPGSDDTTDPGTTSATTAVGTSTTEGATSVVTTAVDTSTADGPSSGDGPGCPPFTDEPSPGTITLEIVNMRPEAVWLPMLPGCIDPVPWVLTGPDGAETPWRAPDCGTCEGAVQGSCPCPPPFCDEATALYLEAGASVQYTWNGLVHTPETVPETCPGIADCGATCERAILPAAGSYDFAIQAGGATGCSVEPCACVPTDGSCTLLDPGMSFTMLTDYGASIDLPGGTTAQISIR